MNKQDLLALADKVDAWVKKNNPEPKAGYFGNYEQSEGPYCVCWFGAASVATYTDPLDFCISDEWEWEWEKVAEHFDNGKDFLATSQWLREHVEELLDE